MSLRPVALATLGLALFGVSFYGLALLMRPQPAALAGAEPDRPVASRAASSVAPVASAVASPATLSVLGEVLYGRHCQACHGLRGEGGMGPALRGLRDAAAVRKAIALGRPANGMPALGARLTSGEVEAVTTYVRTL